MDAISRDLTLDPLRQLKLTGVCDALEQQRAQPDSHVLYYFRTS